MWLTRSGSARLASRRLSTSTDSTVRIAMVGCGKMAEALADGLQTTFPRLDLHAHDINKPRSELFKSRFGATVHSSSSSAVEGANLVVLACKPQNIDDVGQALAGSIDEDAIVLSILAGTPLAVLSDKLTAKRVVRSMPNTPAAVKEGITVWMGTPELSADDNALVSKVLGAFGQEHQVHDEKFLDMATAISGSGPAYVLLLMESMIDTGVHLGFPRAVARKLVLQTVRGTAIYADSTDDASVNGLRGDITSPGGTTASALYELERGGFRTTVSDGLWAAFRRSLELGGQDSNVGPNRSSR
tara:strand:+ start:351 stop:1253 length:903 start_codon:yes stop_codon:yes gene_type:complete